MSDLTQPPVIPEFDTKFVSYFMLMAAFGHVTIRDHNRRAWLLSAVATTIISLLGSIELVRWALNPYALSDILISTMLVEILKAYLLVDLVYSALWHPDQLELVDGWIHHVVYIVVMENLQQSYQIHCTRPLWVAEIPAAIRAWTALGVISPRVSNRWFGATFVAFRIVWPAYVITQILSQMWVFCFVGLTIVVHTGWFAIWMWRRNTRLVLDGEL